jgi:hypothetical protein
VLQFGHATIASVLTMVDQVTPRPAGLVGTAVCNDGAAVTVCAATPGRCSWRC